MTTGRQQMLRGRESLIRLIGKRRRVLPNRSHLLSVPTPNSLNLEVDENGILISVAAIEKAMDIIPRDEDLTCPVCMNKLSGGDHMINLHLDLCLSRGTKRKLTQTTLFQSKLWSAPKVKCHSDNDVKPTQPEYNPEQEVNFGVSDLCEQQQLAEAAVEHDDSCSSDSICCKVDAPSSPNNEVLGEAVSPKIDDAHGLVLDTFIVGRKFSDVLELNIGAKISLLRDPDNIKDHNAIKVLSVEFEPSEMLGYLPRDISHYLSPLIDKYTLKFEGTVTSTPNYSYEVVPIKILCHKMSSNDRMKCEDAGDFRPLWDKVLQNAEYQKKFPPKMQRYQHNFNILIQEVLRSYSHLFTPCEKALLESFPSLSEDSQRLFVRLYMRKGPWFRQSNISYPEVSDLERALKDLTERGFMSLFEDANALDDQDIKEILDTLNVSELRDIVSMNMVSRRSLRKRDLISSLCSSYSNGTSPLLGSMILERTGLCAKISSVAESLIWRIERLFFLNAEQDLSSFVLLDLGIVKYPTYNCIVSEQIFLNQTDLLAYEEAIEVAQIMDESLDKSNAGTVLKCILIADSRLSPNMESRAAFTCFTASWVYSKIQPSSLSSEAVA
ncbi:PREDICTED: fanconi-associated nuclease 1 homolog isoform X2 [Tarenaya hassleriana]|uniref:fanconi-associated nuclease 1 homolog isoform X2 n=1 Tax=Tarenaya hassleriana TaxID=28532 RepID=UPI00053C4DAF|nr:PREDICTED: fanconi-associated nuclease 1 homolog isoform X2 [Tarenaya hassleriana]